MIHTLPIAAEPARAPLPGRPSSLRPGHPNPLAIRPAELAARLGTSTRNLYHLIKHPDPAVRLPQPFKIGRGTFWRVAEIEDWLTRQAERRAA